MAMSLLPYRIAPDKQDSQSVPLVFDSPHSGADYPADFQYACDFNQLQRAEDKYVDELFDGAIHCGASFLCANFPRSYIDVNRAETDIDTELLSESWPEDIEPTSRSHAGIGLIRRLVRPGLPVYGRPLTNAEVQARIETYYRPYHTALEKLLADTHYRFGMVYHINCHSMPAPALAQNFGFLHAFAPPDFVLGDRDGTTCDPAFTRAVRDYLKSQGYRVAINDPYKGVELVSRYSNPATNRHSLQIEVGRWLYMDEETCRKSRGFVRTKSAIDGLIGFIADYVQAQALPLAAD